MMFDFILMTFYALDAQSILICPKLARGETLEKYLNIQVNIFIIYRCKNGQKFYTVKLITAMKKTNEY